MQKTIFTILIVVFLSVPLVGQEAALPESTQPDSTEIGSLSEKEPAYRKKPHIAILPFTNANAQAKEAEFGRTVSAMLATALRNQTNFIVLERNELHQVLTEQVLPGIRIDQRANAGSGKNIQCRSHPHRRHFFD